MNRLLHPLYAYPLAALSFLRAVFQTLRLLGLDHRPLGTHPVPVDYFGVNVAPGEDTDSDDYIVARLRELGLSQVRMHFSYESLEGPAQRLLERLLEAGYEVLLDLMPPPGEAAALFDDVEARQRWCQFLEAVFERYGESVACFELGNTPNRGRWSGFSSPAFVMASYLGHETARRFGLRLGGPNVSDFEPLYNGTYLDLLRRLDATPAVHTDNLFVERVIEPEAYDHRVLGVLARDHLKLNLIKKARTLEAIGRTAGCRSLYCTYTCWTIKRLQRRSAWPEQKRVDYLLRYLVLSAASGALARVYWGPLICSRDGLIDDGADDYPVVDQVSYYQRIRGHADKFRPTPAFAALATAVQRLGGAHCLRIHHDPAGLTLAHYRDRSGAQFLLAWCRDARCVPLDQVLDEPTLAGARFRNACGEPTARPLVITEHPLYIELSETPPSPVCNNLQNLRPRGEAHLCDGHWQSAPYRDERWCGAQMLRAQHQPQDREDARSLHPEKLGSYPELRILRDKRNRLWNIADPRGLCDQVTVKLNRVVGFKRFSYRFRPSKGRRHWDNACQLLRRGIATPLPLAFYEAHERAGIRDSWYLCQFVPDAFSAREVYAAFRGGDSRYRGLDKEQWLDLIAGFVCNMHTKQVIHRDLSSGNLLLAQDESGAIHPQLIDIGRAWIWTGPGSRVRDRHRMLDLIRIAYKLDWDDRARFIERYETHLGKSITPLWRLPFHYYDYKQRFKKALKSRRRKRGNT